MYSIPTELLEQNSKLTGQLYIQTDALNQLVEFVYQNDEHIESNPMSYGVLRAICLLTEKVCNIAQKLDDVDWEISKYEQKNNSSAE